MQKDSLLKQVTVQVGSGGAAGFSEICVMHPLDLVKTRLQMQRGLILNVSDPICYTGIYDCFKKMYAHEGMMSYYKGVLPPILVETPKRALKFFTFEQYKKIFMFGSSEPTPLTFALAGLSAGITEGIMVNPFEVVKVALQANKAKSKDVPSTGEVTKQILKVEGIRGLNKGLTATLFRNGTFNMIYFGFYHSVKGLLPVSQDPIEEFAKKVIFGFTAGVLASCVNIPFDVIKTRIQMPRLKTEPLKYSSTLVGIVIIYKEEGFRALYKGLLPKVLRLGPGGAIMLVVYDYMHEFLSSTITL